MPETHERDPEGVARPSSIESAVPPSQPIDKGLAMHRYLVLIHFASKWTRDDIATIGPKVIAAVRGALDDSETVLTTPQAIGVCGVSSKSARELWTALQLPLFRQDNVSVVTLGEDVVTTHPGFSEWDSRTRWLSRMAPGRPK